MSRIYTIIIKEMRDLIRDRRTMFFMVVFPAIVIPLLIGGITKLTIFLSSKEMDKTITIAIAGNIYDDELTKFFESERNINIITNLSEDTFQKQIYDDNIDAGIVIPINIKQNLKTNKPVEIKYYFRAGKGENFTESRIDKILDKYFSPILESRYKLLKIDKNIFEPFFTTKIDIATEQEKFGKTVGTFLPYIFLLCCLTGATYPALGLGVSEKERGTLETILTSPASQFEILFGKFIVVSFFGIMSVISVLIGIFVVVNLLTNIPQEILSIGMKILSIESISLMFFLLIPLSLLFAAFLLSISFYSKTFKEAQSIMGPLQMIVIFITIIGTMPGITLNFKTAWIPILNVSLAMNDIISGTLSYSLYFFVVLSLLFFTFFSIWLSIKFMSREDVIFRG